MTAVFERRTALAVAAAVLTALAGPVSAAPASAGGPAPALDESTLTQPIRFQVSDLDPGAPAKRMPRGFEVQAGTPIEAAIKRTRWIVSRPLGEAEVLASDLPDVVAGLAADARPLLDFGWTALDRA